jgi:hypothetical protein
LRERRQGQLRLLQIKRRQADTVAARRRVDKAAAVITKCTSRTCAANSKRSLRAARG